MSNPLIHKAVKPADWMPSGYGNKPEKHAWELEQVRSVNLSELFPTMTPAIYNEGNDLEVIAERTRQQLAKIDMSMIKPYDTINLCCSEHGFGLMGGKPYLAMIKTIKEEVEKRTNNQRIRLVLSMYRTPSEAKEVIEHFNLRDEIDCEIISTGPFDEGTYIETSIGPVLGLKKVFDCDWMIYAYYDDPREQYVHRANNRVLKSFMMNFMRYETRSSAHRGFGCTSQMMIPTAVYESEFVQNKFAFASIMMTSPTGVCDIMANKDLFVINKVSMANMTRNYNMVKQLFASLDQWIGVLDGERWMMYLHSAGTVFGVATQIEGDFYDLEIPYVNNRGRAVIEYEGGKMNVAMGLSDNFKGAVMNQTWIGIPAVYMPLMRPGKFFIVGDEQVELYKTDKTNQGFGPGTAMQDVCIKVDTLEEGIEKCIAATGCDKYIIFDGSFGHINCSESMAEELIAKAAAAEKKALEEWPKFLRQRLFTEEEIAEMTK